MRRKHFYMSGPLDSGQALQLEPSLHHRLCTVLRYAQGAELAVFNGTNGLFAATLTDPKRGKILLSEQIRAQTTERPLKLALCLPKKDALETAFRQATELGVTEIFPLLSDFTVTSQFNDIKANAWLIEAAEQSERLTLPVLHPLQPLAKFIEKTTTPIAWCYERATPSASLHERPTTALIGPEGGFSPTEIAKLQAHPQMRPLSLSHNVLRVDTAVAAALTLLAQG